MGDIGRVLFALGMGALGALSLIHADFILEWSAVPDALPARTLFAYAQGALLIAAGLALLFPATRSAAALALAALWAIYACFHIPLTLANWKAGVGGQAESLALVAMSLLLSEGPAAKRARRYVFGLCMPACGLVHFLYPDAVATWIPHWIPGPGLFWAYATGAAHVAAGLAVLSGALAPLASTLNAAMYGSWFLLLHIPRTIAAPQDRHEWTTTFVALAFNGGAWALMHILRRKT
ncbi:MAG TPA: hypothetical protein VG841_08460 [Caulobacterales bacterium]|nr:hypothetical protein [Caulobacterales bacterium]